MCKAVDAAAFYSIIGKSKHVLVKNTDHLEYLCEFHDHPDRFVQ